ncbi:hypothetical protein [Spirosoma flavus]
MKNLTQLIALLFITLTASAQDNIIITSPVSGTPGFQNVMIGVNIPRPSSSINSNVILGYRAAAFTNSVESSVIIGPSAGHTMGPVSSNVIIGNGAGFNNRASNVVTIGQNAGKVNTGPGNIFIGSEAGQNYQGESSVIIGSSATRSSTTALTKGRGATYIGHEVAQEDSASTTGTYIGFRTGSNFRTGASNTFIGSAAGTGGLAPAFGRGSFNTFIGDNAGGLIFRTNENVFVGYRAGFLMSEGKGNVVVGTNAASDPSGITPSRFNDIVLIGNKVQAKNGIRNAGAIGAGARVDTSDALVLGNSTMRVGIGTTKPQNRLEIVAESANTSGLRLSKLTSQSPADVTSAKYLSVNDQGDVILVNNPSTDVTAILNRLTALESANADLTARVQFLESRRCFICFPCKPKTVR